MFGFDMAASLIFQSTPLIRGATSKATWERVQVNFNPRPSYEERPANACKGSLVWPDFNPRPSYEERPSSCHMGNYPTRISIHAPHTRSDQSC